MKFEQKKESPLGYHEEKALVQEEKHLQDIKDGIELNQGIKLEVDDLSALEKRLTQIKELRAVRGVNGGLSDKEKNYLEKREKILREHLQGLNPTYKEYSSTRPVDGPRYTKLVQHTLKNMQDKEYQEMVRDWKDTRRKLYPDDPYASDTRLIYREE